MRMAPPEENADPDRRSVGGVHPRDRARVPQSRRSSRSRPSRSRSGRRSSPASSTRTSGDGDLGRRAAGRGRDRQRHRLRRGGAGGVPVGAVRLGEPARDARRVACPRRFRACRSTTRASGRRSGRSTTVSTRSSSPSTTTSAPRWASRRARRTSSTRDSPWLNLYLFPETADYERSQPLGRRGIGSSRRCGPGRPPSTSPSRCPATGRWSTCRSAPSAAWTSGLMQRLIDAMATTEHRTVVSMGPLKDQMTLGPNMYGDEFLPQPSILPQCDLLITHGGNNTTCEGFHFGLPMIGLPLFWDQYDNAQRVDETGFGVRLAHLRLGAATAHRRGRPAARRRRVARADGRDRKGRSRRPGSRAGGDADRATGAHRRARDEVSV